MRLHRRMISPVSPVSRSSSTSSFQLPSTPVMSATIHSLLSSSLSSSSSLSQLWSNPQQHRHRKYYTVDLSAPHCRSQLAWTSSPSPSRSLVLRTAKTKTTTTRTTATPRCHRFFSSSSSPSPPPPQEEEEEEEEGKEEGHKNRTEDIQPSEPADDNTEGTSPPPPPPPPPSTTTSIPTGLFYIAPMADLVTRLKVISITSCFLSVVVMPSLICLKNGDLPSAKQTTVGGVALFGAVGSTAALHFVFGPYVTQLSSYTVSQQQQQQQLDDADDYGGDSSSDPVESSSSHNHDGDMDDGEESPENTGTTSTTTMIEATTRSVFGWSNKYTFDPLTDVTEYKGAKPFANLAISSSNNKHGTAVPLFIHADKLDDDTRHLIFGSLPSQQQPLSSAEEQDQQQQQREKNEKGEMNRRNEGIKDDDWF
eukprot:CAMPEP_0113471262 /NCGR_PEP_ID=MMETSP0014_2-20120614/16886_1 /TAXON_ID=2857 /ORGANISM="Nitzschia sp." /LENGTH=422 /DNA_ID=CAMNT_0000363889 /DNA_START=615 /DNA_END=1883 /DNA_ORIENTATION=+ /assembly_acc=CAM_ASM_000159